MYGEQLIRELDRAQTIHKAGHRSEIRIPGDGKSKAEAISGAGLSASAAYRYEELAGSRNERAEKSATFWRRNARMAHSSRDDRYFCRSGLLVVGAEMASKPS